MSEIEYAIVLTEDESEEAGFRFTVETTEDGVKLGDGSLRLPVAVAVGVAAVEIWRRDPDDPLLKELKDRVGMHDIQ